MTNIAILDDYQQVALQSADWDAVRARASIQVFHHPLKTLEEAAETLAQFDILCAMRERRPFPAELLMRLPKLRCLVTTGSLNASIDLAAARRQGIVVCATRDGAGRHTTGELTWALILGAAKRLLVHDRVLRTGGWQSGIGAGLHGKTLGLLGLGQVGGMVARIGRAFGMRVIAWSQNLTPEHAQECGAERVERDTLFRDSDFLSVHVVLSKRTRGLVGTRELEMMKSTAWLVNTSRGPIVEEASLIDALNRGTIAGAALDVFAQEPLPDDHPFRSMQDNVILTPHVGYVTDEVYRTWYGDTVEAVLGFLDGRPVRVLT